MICSQRILNEKTFHVRNRRRNEKLFDSVPALLIPIFLLLWFTVKKTLNLDSYIVRMNLYA